MTIRTDFSRHGARIAVALALLTVYQKPVPVRLPAPLAAVPLRTRAPAVAGADVQPLPPAAPAVPEAPPAMPLADPFVATSWAPPAPAPAPAPVQAATAAAVDTAPAPAVAPPLPFVYVGRYVEGGRQVVMLLKGEQLLLLQQGDTIDNMYRLERVAADRIELTYLPLGMRQSVRTLDSA